MATTKSQSKSKSASKSAPAKSTRSGKRPARQTAQAIEPNEMQVEELVLQALETELGGVQVYETAIRCAQEDELREEWEKYHEQTQNHVRIVLGVFEKLGLDPEKETPGRAIVRQHGETLVQLMETALQEAPGEAAQLVAAECVVTAETKDHQNWSLIGELADAVEGEWKEAFEEAYEEVEDEEDEHLYHTMGWCRELWIQSLGLPAAIPPPEEEKDVESMAEAAKAKGQRKQYAKKAK